MTKAKMEYVFDQAEIALLFKTNCLMTDVDPKEGHWWRADYTKEYNQLRKLREHLLSSIDSEGHPLCIDCKTHLLNDDEK